MSGNYPSSRTATYEGNNKAQGKRRGVGSNSERSRLSNTQGQECKGRIGGAEL